MRFLPHTDDDRRAMLAAVGADSVNGLFADIPDGLIDPPLDLPPPMGELGVERALGALARRNVAAGDVPFFLGAGAYRHHVPASVDALVQRGEFLTSYTPYQPEISQGTLQTLFEFQTQVALLTGMEVANASMYDGSTACAEAALMATRITRRSRVVLADALHPHWREVTETFLRFGGIACETAGGNAPPGTWDGLDGIPDDVLDETAAVVVQVPDVFGATGDIAPLARRCHERGALLVAAVPEVVSLGALAAPGERGADIVVCEGQSLGVGLAFGGPYVGLFATRDGFVRNMPGRIAGETVDREGRRSYVLTLAAREQHIRRGKATSNICTNSGLCALAFSIHLALLGEEGFRRLALLNHEAAVRTADRLAGVPGVEVRNATFFNEFTVDLGRTAAPVVERLAAEGVLAGVPASRLFPDRDDVENLLLVAATETATGDDVARLADALRGALA